MRAPSTGFLKRRLDPAQRYGLRVTLLAGAILLGAIPFAALLFQVTGGRRIVRLDTAASQRLSELRVESRAWAAIFNSVSFLAFPPWVWLLIGSVAVYLWIHKHPRLIVYLLSTTLGGALINTLVKQAVNRPRPRFADPNAFIWQDGKSFPSGHAMLSVVAYGALLLIFLPAIPRKRRKAAIAGAACLILAIGASRLALGVHYLSDVAAGYLLGAAWLTASTAAFSIWRAERGKPPAGPMEGVEPESTAGREGPGR